MKAKKTTLCLLIALTGISFAGSFNVIVGQERSEYTIGKGSSYSNWTNVDTPYDCIDRYANDDFYIGATFTQIADCKQKQERTLTTITIVDGNRKESSVTETQVIDVESTRDEIGTYLAKSCKEILETQGNQGSKAYTIYLDNSAKTVFCDMATDGGGWTIVADQNLYVEGYPSVGGTPDDDPNNVQSTRITRWPKYTEYAIKSVIDLHGAPADLSVVPEFRKFNTGNFGEVEVDMISFLLNKNDFQNGRASNDYVMFNGVPWGDSNAHASYYGYYWFGKNGMTYNHWGQADVWGHLVNSDLFRISSNYTGYARTAGCGAAWANNACRESKTAWVYRNTVKQKAVFMVR